MRECADWTGTRPHVWDAYPSNFGVKRSKGSNTAGPSDLTLPAPRYGVVLAVAGPPPVHPCLTEMDQARPGGHSTHQPRGPDGAEHLSCELLLVPATFTQHRADGGLRRPSAEAAGSVQRRNQLPSSYG